MLKRAFFLFVRARSNVFSSSLSFSFSKNHIFQHACATPLTILLSNLEQELVSNVGLKNENRLKSSLEAVRKLIKIIKSSSDNCDLDEEFMICGAINEVICLLDTGVEKKYIGCKVLINKDLSLVGNKLYFQEALSCVLNNSIEAYKETRQKPISLVVRKVEGSLRVDVVDYASGMGLIEQKMVLLNGITTKKNGMGLGLNFAKKTIEEIFSGEMLMKSTLGFGTHTTWTIPLEKPYSQSL